jgi:hypothetical protein
VTEEKRCYDEAAGEYCQSLTFRDAHGVSSYVQPASRGIWAGRLQSVLRAHTSSQMCMKWNVVEISTLL